MATRDNTTGLILAGGAGRRVGGRDKGLMPFRGQTMAAHVVQRLRPQVAKLLISCNRNREAYAALAATTVTDTREGFQGPLAGLEAAIPLIDTEFLVITPVDTPLLPPDLVDRLLAALTDMTTTGTGTVCYAHDGHRSQYLCAALRTDCLPTLHPFLDKGHRAVRHWYRQFDCRAVDFSDQSACFRNFNRPD